MTKVGEKVGLNLQNKRTIRNLAISDEFEKELDVIKDLVLRCREKEVEMNNIYSEAKTLSNKFIEKYSEYNPIIGDYSSYVDKSLTANQLLLILSEESNMEPHKLKERIKGMVHNSQTIDPIEDNNEMLIKKYENFLNKVELIESREHISERNTLSKDIYLINDKLRDTLNNAWVLPNSRLINNTDKDGFYMVVFNFLNTKNKRTLVYNTIKYNKIFLDCFLVYILIEQMSMSTCTITTASDFFFFLDAKLKSLFDSYLAANIEKRYRVKTEQNEDYIHNNKVYPLNFIEMLKIVFKWEIPLISNEYMSEIIACISFNIRDITNKLNTCCNIGKYNPKNPDLLTIWYNRLKKENKANNKHIFNNISKFVFIVSDLDLLLNNLKKAGFDSVNAGPQKFRGNASYIGYINTILDRDFRDNLWRHNVWWSFNYNKPLFPRSVFSFKNIHINLGSVRWYSQEAKPLEKSPTLRENSAVFNGLKHLILNNPINESTQIKLEKFLLESAYTEEKGFNLDYMVSGNFTKLLIGEVDNIRKLISNFKKEYVTYRGKEEEYPLNIKAKVRLAKILAVVGREYITNIMLGRLLRIMTSYKRSTGESINMVNIGFELGKDLMNRYHYVLYSRDKNNSSKNIRFSVWMAQNKDKLKLVDEFSDNPLLFTIGSVLVDWMIFLKLVDIKTITIALKEKSNILIPSSRILSEMSKEKTPVIYHLPQRLPMIVKPKQYSSEEIGGKEFEKLGGYLLNDEMTNIPLVKKSPENKEHSSILKKNIIYDLVNNISSIPYKVNVDVLDFILIDKPEYFIDEMCWDSNNPLLEKPKLTIKQKRELDSYLSKKELQDNIIGIATIFSQVPEFYFPVKLDYRGRLYCIPEYFNYQSCNLAKALLLFKKGDKIIKNDETAINYFKIYGANCFGLDKKSFNERVKWVDNNVKNIENFWDGELIKKADNKLLFLAFCFEFNRWLQCANNHDVMYFETYLPIQMDATCNGFQHLSLLSSDKSLAKELNLTKSTWADKPKDFYSFLLNNLISYFQQELSSGKVNAEYKEGYERLVNMNIQRKIIKKSIMTIPYNVSDYQLVKYIKDNFIQSEPGWYHLNNDTDVKLKHSDFMLLGKGLRSVLSEKFPKLSSLLKYLEAVAERCFMLNIPIPWTLPSGVYIKQSYVEDDKVRLKPFSYHKSTFTLRVRDKNQLSRAKQVRSFMPNLVHSLDATSLALLVDLYFKSNNIHNIFSVHDCFAVTANRVGNVMELLKLVYTKIYSNDLYLEKLDRDIKNSIKVHFGEDAINEELLIKPSLYEGKKELYYFPDIQDVLDKSLDYKSLRDSSYILN